MKKCSVRKRLMGSDFELIACGEDEAWLKGLLDAGIAEIQRLEHLLTAFSGTSDTGRINAMAGIAPVAIDAEVLALIQRCLQLSQLTQGAFDISSGALKKLYDFKNREAHWPDEKQRLQALQATGFEHILINDNGEVMLARKGMHIGFGAVGKGYAADRVRKIWQDAGLSSGVVNASGDLSAWGTQADGAAWKVGIANPDAPDEMLLWLPLENAAVATSGNYEQFIDRDGVRYSHNIDPLTGLPARYLKSVTVVSPSAELSDALATAVTVLGTAVGLDFIRQLPQVHAVIIDEHNILHTSEKVKQYVQEPVR